MYDPCAFNDLQLHTTLNELALACQDLHAALRSAADHTDDPRLSLLLGRAWENLFRNRAELLQELGRLGGQAQDGPHVRRLLWQTEIAIRSALNERRALANSCNHQVVKVARQYAVALAAGGDPRTRQILRRHVIGLQRLSDRLRDISGRA